MDTDKLDILLRDHIPSECWGHIISYLPRLSRQALACLCGFKEFVDGELAFDSMEFYTSPAVTGTFAIDPFSQAFDNN